MPPAPEELPEDEEPEELEPLLLEPLLPELPLLELPLPELLPLELPLELWPPELLLPELLLELPLLLLLELPLPELPPGAPLLLEPAPLELPPMEPLLLEVLPPELLLPPLELPELLVLLEPPLEELLPASWELLLPLEQAARPSVRARPQTSPSIGFSVIVRLHRSEAGNTAATWREAALRRGFSAWLNAGRILGARCGKLDDKKAMNLKLQATPYIGLAGSIQDLTFAPVSDQINQSFN